MSNTYFEQWSDDRFYNDQAIYKLVLTLTSGLVKGDVLDLGCGSRIYYDTSKVKNWCGVDVSPILLKQITFLSAVMPSGEITTMQSSCFDLEFPANNFDTVCAIFLLHHLGKTSRRKSRERVSRVMKSVYQFLKPGGKFFIMESWPHVIIHLYNYLYPICYPVVRRSAGVELPYFFSGRALSQMATNAGFSECHILGIPLYETARYPIGSLSMPGWLQPAIHKYGMYVFVK